MYLSRLELHGFKSFADRTVVDFSPGVTVVVGPNGCGKSNIVDAIRWVIGEQRARILRSEKMDNVIFNGTADRRSLGMSEVMLTIENTRGILPIEFGEVTIGRRLFRSGESEYLLNGVQCRLKDITDLFMDTGMGAGAYSVIELKMIEDILSENAQDRRHMFEEASGITKYKIRRNQTLNKLGSTQTDLDRVRDLIEELDSRVSSLQRQANKASRFKSLDEGLNLLILSLAAFDFEKMAAEDSELDNGLKSLGDQISGLSATLAAEEADHEAFRKRHIEKEQILVAAQTDLSNHVEMLRSAEADLRLNNERQDGITRDLVRADDEEKHAAIRRETLQSILERTAIELETARPAVEETSIRLDTERSHRDIVEKTVQKQRELRHELSEKERVVLDELSERRRQIERLSSRIEVLDLDIDENQSQRSDIVERLSELDSLVEHTATSLDEARSMRDSALDVLDKARTERTAQSASLEDAEANLHRCERQLDALDAEIGLLESLLSTYEDFSESVRFLAETPDWTDGQAQTVADILACDDKYRAALDQALGPFASCFVVKSESSVAQAIARLRKENKGRATFLILDRLNPSRELHVRDVAKNAIALASVVRTPSDKFDALTSALLHSCFLVDDVARVQHDSPVAGRYFTETGEWYDAVGLRYGGSSVEGTTAVASRLGRREQLEKASVTRQDALTRHEELVNAVESVRRIVDSLPIESLEAQLQQCREAVTEAEKQQSRIAYEREILRRRRDEIETRQANLDDSKETALTATTELSQGLNDLQKEANGLGTLVKKAESDVEVAEAESRDTFLRFNEANIIAVQAHHRVDSLEREEQRTELDQQTLDEESKARAKRVAVLKIRTEEARETAKSLEKEIQQMRQRRGDLDRAVSEAKDELVTVKVTISDLEVRLRVLRRDRETAVADESRQSIRRAEIKIRLEDLIQTILEDYEIDLPVFDIEIDPDFSAKQTRSEIATLRTKIRNLGPVNALALDSFEDEKDRLEFLRTQLADLEHAEGTLLETINEINQTASERFDRTFDAIQANFQELFSELFGEGASAEIVLESPDDPLESPIEIRAKPSGKKPCVLAQLSSGEKTLTAIALLFAIYLVKPSPFCILDEVDAPLDDANIDRFMHLIRTFSDSTQFVLVTHNKRTMEAADRLYGITMQEHGISKLVGVKLDQKVPLVA